MLRQLLQIVKETFYQGILLCNQKGKKLHNLPKALQSGLPRRADGTRSSAKEPEDSTAAVSTSALACSSPAFPCTDQIWASFYNDFNISQQCWKLFLGMKLASSQLSQAAGASHAVVTEVRMPPPVLPGGTTPLTGTYLDVCPEAQSACPSQGTTSLTPPTVSPSRVTKKPARGWEGLTAVRAEPPLPPPALCFTGRSYYQEMFPSAPLIPLFTAQ